ncbi:alkaline phosphatase family protein, partial [Halorubrum sp. SP9]|uniref:alkaline phosphatase family protein n=1 Tax=Halorubrum sp. SP9 TaxID=1537267 RepID=UPI0034E0C582
MESAEQRATVAKNLMTEHSWQFFFGLFIATDRAQHKLWDTPEEILPVYKEIDDFIGWIRERYPKANVI